MKEAFAAERGECLDRMDRRALRERIAIERQQVSLFFADFFYKQGDSEAPLTYKLPCQSEKSK